MLYDYATHQLDKEREESVRLAINQNPTLAEELENILYGISYCKKISQTITKPVLIQKMKQPFSPWQLIEKLLNLRSWNPGFQWLGEAIVITVSLLLLSFFVPWESLVFNFIAKNNKQIILTSINKKPSQNSSLSLESKGRAVAQAPSAQEFKPEILRKYKLTIENPDFTYNKLLKLFPNFGVSLIDQDLVLQAQDKQDKQAHLSKIITLSLPQDRAEALIKEIETNGKLTLLYSTGENEKEKEIWTFQIELEKEVK